MTWFYRFSRDLIDYVLTVSEDIGNNQNLLPGESYFWTQNIGLLNTWGMEAQLEGVHDLKDGLALEWGISCQALTSNNDGNISKYLSAHARNLVNARMGLKNKLLRLQVTSLYKNRDAEVAEVINESLSSRYTLFNLRADVFFSQEHLMLSLQVNNLCDRTYADILGAKMPGRWIAGGLTWNFTDK